VFGIFAAVALAIALVGVAGVLAFSVSARTREFGVRLAIGAQPRQLLASVIAEGAVMATAGVVAGAACGYVLVRLARSAFREYADAERLQPFLASSFWFRRYATTFANRVREAFACKYQMKPEMKLELSVLRRPRQPDKPWSTE